MAACHAHVVFDQGGQLGLGVRVCACACARARARALHRHRRRLRQGGQRCLDRVVQITRLRARPRHDLGIAVEQRIEVIDQGLHLSREAAVQPLCRACTHPRQGALQRTQGRQADNHLRQCRRSSAGSGSSRHRA